MVSYPKRALMGLSGLEISHLVFNFVAPDWQKVDHRHAQSGLQAELLNLSCFLKHFTCLSLMAGEKKETFDINELALPQGGIY